MLELTFITSSKEKISHAIYLSKDYPVQISKQKNYGIGYIEPRIGSREELIRRSVEDAILRFKKTTKNADEKFFIIEDTSVIIEELSKKAEYPGVDVKYWMRENNFLSVDKMLKEAGNNRAVTVRSDVILVLNKKLREKFNKKYISFTSFSKGHIVDKEVPIKTQPLYPWLNNRTFNKWFVPIGENEPISKLPINKADKYDFRVGAFKDLFAFLKLHNYLNPNTSYEQLELFEPVAFIICGPSCAGKTTLSSFLQDKYNYFHFEASDFMYLSYYDAHGVKSNVAIGDFAEDALKKNPTIVTNQILRYLRQFKHTPILVTGFRSHLEVEQFLKKYRGGLNIEVIYVESDEKIRFERNVERNRADVVDTIEKFQKKDLQQFKMGLSIIKERFVQGNLENNDTLDELYEVFESKYQNQLQGGLMNYNRRLPESFKRRSLENVVIQVLFNNTLKSYTTTEISHLIKKSQISLPKSKNNISRYFNQNFHPFYEISINEDGKITYRLSQTGKSYGKWISRNLTDGLEF